MISDMLYQQRVMIKSSLVIRASITKSVHPESVYLH